MKRKIILYFIKVIVTEIVMLISLIEAFEHIEDMRLMILYLGIVVLGSGIISYEMMTMNDELKKNNARHKA